MKRVLFFLAALLNVALISGQAQTKSSGNYRMIEINPMVGYQFGGRMNFYEGNFKIYDNLNYGGNLDFILGRRITFELGYTRMDSHGYWQPFPGFEKDYPYTELDIAVNYFQVGILKEAWMNKVKPFGLFTVGATWFEPKTPSLYDVWQFSIALGGCVKVFLNDFIGLRFQGRLLLPMYFTGVGFYFGSGGSGITVSSSTVFVQGDFSGGLIFALGKR